MNCVVLMINIQNKMYMALSLFNKFNSFLRLQEITIIELIHWVIIEKVRTVLLIQKKNFYFLMFALVNRKILLIEEKDEQPGTDLGALLLQYLTF